MASSMAFASGGISSSPSMDMLPQHFTAPSWRMAQELWCPASIWEKLPGGESISLEDSVRRSSSPWTPQQAMVPSARSPQVWNGPAETWVNGMPELGAFVDTVRTSGCSVTSGVGVDTVGTSGCSVASWEGVGAGMVGVRPSVSCVPAGDVGSWVGCPACVGVGPLPASGSGVAAWAQPANTSARVAAVRQRIARLDLSRSRETTNFCFVLSRCCSYLNGIACDFRGREGRKDGESLGIFRAGFVRNYWNSYFRVTPKCPIVLAFLTPHCVLVRFQGKPRKQTKPF